VKSIQKLKENTQQLKKSDTVAVILKHEECPQVFQRKQMKVIHISHSLGTSDAGWLLTESTAGFEDFSYCS